MIQMKRRLTVSSEASPFGCCGYFDQCADGIFSLYYRGSLGLLDLLNFQPTDTCKEVIEYINYIRPEQSQSESTEGALSDPCADPYGFEFGNCTLSIEDFGRIGRHGPTREIMKPKYYCKTSPRYTFDGEPIANEDEWDMTFAMDQILNDVRGYVIDGDAATAGEFDGLENIVTTGYDCPQLDSYVIDWNYSTLGNSVTATINGQAIADGSNLYDVLNDVIAQIKQRISWSPVLGTQNIAIGDVVAILPTFLVRCALDGFTCYSLCADSVHDTYEARTFRKELITGPNNLFGYGYFETDDGMPIPFMTHDWNISTGTAGDAYILFRAVGNQRLWEGQFLSPNGALSEMPELSSKGYFAAGERTIGLYETDNMCKQMKLWQYPRIFCRAPWAQIRIQNISCVRSLNPISPDAGFNASFYPGQNGASFTPAECPTGSPGISG